MIGIVHVHSTYSHDGVDRLADLAHAARRNGVDFVALTDHAEDLTAEDFDRLVRECRELSTDTFHLIPGLEFRFRGHPGLHLLAHGLWEWIEPDTPEAFVALASSRCGFTMLAHPRLCRYRVPGPVLDGLDAVEVWNAAYDTRYLPDPEALALLRAARRRAPHLVAVAGLDQHDQSNDRGLRVVLNDPNAIAPLPELRAGRFRSGSPWLEIGSDGGSLLGRLGLLGPLRWTFDRVERIQDRVARARRRRRR